MAFIKTHKTASTTLAMIFVRYSKRHEKKVLLLVVQQLCCFFLWKARRNICGVFRVVRQMGVGAICEYHVHLLLCCRRRLQSNVWSPELDVLTKKETPAQADKSNGQPGYTRRVSG